MTITFGVGGGKLRLEDDVFDCWTMTTGVWAFVPGLEIFLQKKFAHELDSTDWHAERFVSFPRDQHLNF